MENKNCESLHSEYKELREKIRSIIDSNVKSKPYTYINSKDALRMKELAKELVNNCTDYIDSLPAGDRFDLQNNAQD